MKGTVLKKTANLVLLSAGSSEQSTTWRVLTQVGDATSKALGELGFTAKVNALHLVDIAQEVARSIASGRPTDGLQPAIDTLIAADGLIVGTPVYKASYSGLLKSFLDVLDDDMLLAVPTVVAATGGTPRHGLVPDQQMRPLLAYFRALVVPTSVYAATEDLADPAGLGQRIKRAGGELATQISLGTREQTLKRARGKYRRTFDARASKASWDEGLDFDSDLMRLAAGGSQPPANP